MSAVDRLVLMTLHENKSTLPNIMTHKGQNVTGDERLESFVRFFNEKTNNITSSMIVVNNYYLSK